MQPNLSTETAATIIKLSNVVAVKFPFELKADFRSAFPSAKWNPVDKHWELGFRSKTRLEEWVSVVNQKYDINAIAELEKKQLSEQEIERLDAQITKINQKNQEAVSGLRTIEELQVIISKSRSQLVDAEEELARVEAQLQEKKSQQQTAIDEIIALLNSVFNLDDAKKQALTMSSNHSKVDANSKARFESARSIIKDYRDALAEAGLRCEALDIIASANKNRPDRDDPKLVTQKQWLNVTKLEQ